jgi:hypothetical protein
MNNTTTNTTSAAIMVNFYDNYIPALKDGQFTITLSQTFSVAGSNPGNIPAQPQEPASQSFIVRGPRLQLPPAYVSQVFPPDNATGDYHLFLPQLVLNHQSLPWERDLDLSNPTAIPWVALLVFTEDELPSPQTLPQGSQQNRDRSSSVTLDQVITPPSDTLGPSLRLEADEVATQINCNVIDIPVACFNRLIPSIDDLSYLAHTRQVSLQNKALSAENLTNGWFGTVIANRFGVPPASTSTAIGNIVHLVSLEGFETALSQTGPATVDGSKYSTVRMISLYSWTYTSTLDAAQSFSALMTNLVSTSSNAGTDLLLRLPLPSAPPPAQQVQMVRKRLQDGYVPLSYAMLSGDQTFAWYRGPLSPVPVARFLESTGPGQAVNPAVPYSSGDAKIFETDTGLFDLSYATAFQTGRSLALASKAFTQSLLGWRANANSVVDLILEYMNSPVYASKMQQDGLMDAQGNLTNVGVTDLAQLLDGNIVTQAFQDFFSTSLYQSIAANIGKKGGFTPSDSTLILHDATPAKPVVAPQDIINLMQQPQITSLLQHLSGLDNLGALSAPLQPNATRLSVSSPGTSEAINKDTDILIYSPDGMTSAWVTVSADTPINSTTVNIQAYTGVASLPVNSTLQVSDSDQDAQQVINWLAATALLNTVPFNNLVAHPSLLPAETIRFFYLDQNWTDALLDGALSLGIQTGRDSLFQQLMRDKLYEAVQDVMAETRDALVGYNAPSPPAANLNPAGFVLRSQGVAGWPNLEICAWSANDALGPMKPLRLELLASDVLFALYPDIPIKLTFTEPSEGLVFGMEDQGVEMRYIPGVTGYAPAQAGTVIQQNNSPIWANLSAIQRGGENPALNINTPGGNTGLVQLIQAALPGSPELTPASLAVQMVCVPEQLLLTPAN